VLRVPLPCQTVDTSCRLPKNRRGMTAPHRARRFGFLGFAAAGGLSCVSAPPDVTTHVAKPPPVELPECHVLEFREGLEACGSCGCPPLYGLLHEQGRTNAKTAAAFRKCSSQILSTPGLERLNSCMLGTENRDVRPDGEVRESPRKERETATKSPPEILCPASVEGIDTHGLDLDEQRWNECQSDRNPRRVLRSTDWMPRRVREYERCAQKTNSETTGVAREGPDTRRARREHHAETQSRTRTLGPRLPGVRKPRPAMGPSGSHRIAPTLTAS
jgi:hypothetical protein